MEEKNQENKQEFSKEQERIAKEEAAKEVLEGLSDEYADIASRFYDIKKRVNNECSNSTDLNEQITYMANEVGKEFTIEEIGTIGAIRFGAKSRDNLNFIQKSVKDCVEFSATPRDAYINTFVFYYGYRARIREEVEEGVKEFIDSLTDKIKE